MQIPFELSAKPWFGPKQRAREYLAHRTRVLSPEETIAAIVDSVGLDAGLLQAIRFIDFEHKQLNMFRFTIALCWTYSGPVRQSLFDQAEIIVRETGWYPLPQGERLASRSKIWKLWKPCERTALPVLELGHRLCAVESAASSGCCIRLRTCNGNILLDSGLPGEVHQEENDRVVLLSHLHSDHLGGLENGNVRGVPVILSRGTGRLLLSQGRLRRIHGPVYFVDPSSIWHPLGPGLEFHTFRVPHAPGSVGYSIRDQERSVIFSGDLAIRSNRHDFTDELKSILAESKRHKQIFLLDATMAGRAFGASSTDAGKEILEFCKRGESFLLTSGDPEQLVYAYLDLWWKTKEDAEIRSSINFLVSDALRPHFEAIHAHYIGRELSELDPFVLAQYGKTMSAWAESRFLYWQSPASKLIGSEWPSILFLPLKECNQLSARLVQNGKRIGGVAGIGRVTNEDLEQLIKDLQSSSVSLDTSCWTLHSDATVLSMFVKNLGTDCRILLFHNFPGRLRKFISRESLGCEAVSETSIRIDT